VQSAPVPGHISQGQFYPDPVVRQMPVTRTNIYVQAGSFSDQANAEALAQRLSTYGRTGVSAAMVNGRQFYRVRFGPIPSVNDADALLSQLANAGYGDAMTVVD
jgi:rare lipoprotein A